MSIRIALAQINCCVGDIEGNTRKIISFIKKAKDYHSDIVVFPELAIPGYPPEDLLLKQSFVKDNMAALNEIKRASTSIVTVVGFVEFAEKVFNSAAIIQNKKIAALYRKSRLPNYGVFDENRYFQPDNSAGVYKIGRLIFGVNICEDIWYPGDPTKKQVINGNAQLIINISSSPYHLKKPELRENMLRTRASDYYCSLAFCNLVGGQDELVFDGNSCLINERGEVVSRSPQFKEDLLINDIDVKNSQLGRNKNDKTKKSSSIKKRIKPLLLNPPGDKVKKAISAKKAVFPCEEQEIFNALVLGTKDYVRKNGFKKVVIGLSGGIDSSLVAVIATEALGAGNVLGILMPSKFSSKGSIRDSHSLADNLGIETEMITIKEIYSSYIKSLKKHFKGKPVNETEENIQARIRGNILMSFSNKFGYLVLTTGNKSEMSVGYATLYGDMAGGFAVIKDVPKMLVYKLSEFYNM
ncbi:MAG: NAD+ synthase, partial [Thermodesulfobacteriota bacterium]